MKKYGAVTDVGKKRAGNQDAYYIGNGWCIVADGMGGHKGGEVASRCVIEIVKRALLQQSFETDILLKNALSEANAEIYKMSLETPELEGMGTTAVLCRFEGKQAVIAHVGDSRAYRLAPDGLHQVTVDHSIVQQLIASGTITPGEAKTHPQKNYITRAIGTDQTVEVDITRVRVNTGDIVLLCTDGLNSCVSDEEIEQTLRGGRGDLYKTAFELVDLANERGGADNITVILVEA